MTVCSTCDADPRYYQGDIGLDIIVDVCQDITTATKASLIVEKPDGELVEWIGVVYEITNIRYTVVEGDLDQSGVYNVQSYVETPSWSGHGGMTQFRVNMSLTPVVVGDD